MNTPLLWFRSEIRIGNREPMVDWWNATSESEARDNLAEAIFRAGIPLDADIQFRAATPKETEICNETL